MPNKIYTLKRKTDRTWLRNKTITLWGQEKLRAEWDLGRGSQNRQWQLGVFSVHGILQARILEWVSPSPGDLPDPGIRNWVSCITGRFFTTEPPEKPLTSESNYSLVYQACTTSCWFPFASLTQSLPSLLCLLSHGLTCRIGFHLDLSTWRDQQELGDWLALFITLASSHQGYCGLAVPKATLSSTSVQFSCSVMSNSLQPMDCSTLGLPVHHQLSELTQTHVHWVSDAIQSSHPLSSPSPPAFNHS